MLIDDLARLEERKPSSHLRYEASYPATEVVGTVIQLGSESPAAGGEVVLRVEPEEG